MNSAVSKATIRRRPFFDNDTDTGVSNGDNIAAVTTDDKLILKKLCNSDIDSKSIDRVHN